VRILPVALVASAALHGGAVAWIRTMPPSEPERPPLVTLAPIEILRSPAAETPPTEVTLLDDHTVVTAPAPASPGSHTTRRKARISTGAATTTTETPTTTITPPSTEPKSKLMTMRHPKLEHGPSPTFWEKFAANTKPLKPNDIYGERLSDEIASAETNLGNQKWIDNASSEEVAYERARLAAKRYEKSHAELQPDGAGTKAEHKTFRMKVNPDGTVDKLQDKANLQREGLLGGSFDVTDAMMRSKGIDPYSSYKLKVLDETRDERVAIGKRYRTQQLARSRQLIQKQIEQLWSTTGDLATRKRGLFELWDDCAEAGSAELVAAGSAARAHVLGFIQSQLTGTDAYTAEDLAHFNKRRKSRARFAPYEKP
jgi:hypothetical protein